MANLLPPTPDYSGEPCGAHERHRMRRKPRLPRIPATPRVQPARTNCSPLPPHVPDAPPRAAAGAASRARLSPGWGGEPRPAGARPGPDADASGLPDARCRRLSRVGSGLKGLRTAPAPTGHPPLHVHWSHCAHRTLDSGRVEPGLRTERRRAQPNRANWSRANESLAAPSGAQPNRAEW